MAPPSSARWSRRKPCDPRSDWYRDRTSSDARFAASDRFRSSYTRRSPAGRGSDGLDGPDERAGDRAVERRDRGFTVEVGRDERGVELIGKTEQVDPTEDLCVPTYLRDRRGPPAPRCSGSSCLVARTSMQSQSVLDLGRARRIRSESLPAPSTAFLGSPFRPWLDESPPGPAAHQAVFFVQRSSADAKASPEPAVVLSGAGASCSLRARRQEHDRLN